MSRFSGTAFVWGAVLLLALSTTAELRAQIDPESAALAGQVLAGAQVDADGYKFLPVPAGIAKDPRKQAEFLRNVRDLLQDKEPFGESAKTLFNNYYVRYIFTLWTQTDPASLEKLPEERYKFLKDHLEMARNSPAPHNHLVDLTLATMAAIAKDPGFHPACRYHAVHLIGLLNDTEAERVGSNPRTPEPTARALTLHLEILKDPKFTDDLRVAALLGILRQLEWEPFRITNGPLPAPSRADALAQLTALASQKQPPANRSAGGHAWMRRRAIEGLAFSAYSKPDPAVGTLLESILADASEPLLVRCAAAEGIGKINYAAPAKLDAQATAQKLALLAVAIPREEFKRQDDLRKDEELRKQSAAPAGPAQPGGQGGEFFPGGQPGLPGAQPGGPEADEAYALAKQYRLEPVRRRLRAQLYAVQLGLGFPLNKANLSRPSGPAPTAPGTTLFRGCHQFATKPAERGYIEDLLTEINKMADVIEKTDTEMLSLRTALEPLIGNVERLAAKAAVPAVAPPAEGEPAAGELPAALPVRPAAKVP